MLGVGNRGMFHVEHVGRLGTTTCSCPCGLAYTECGMVKNCYCFTWNMIRVGNRDMFHVEHSRPGQDML